VLPHACIAGSAARDRRTALPSVCLTVYIYTVGERASVDEHTAHTIGPVDCPACDALRDSISLSAQINADLTFAVAANLWPESRKVIGR
jgi:hypothetical protein